MKRALTFTALLALSALLPGCPVYPAEGCADSRDCAPGYACDARHGQCVSDDAPSVGSSPGSGRCSVPSDCRQNETCGRDAVCLPGDCTQWGCTSGYVCDVSSGYARCTKASGSGGSGGKSGGSGAGGSSAGAGGSSAGAGGSSAGAGGSSAGAGGSSAGAGGSAGSSAGAAGSSAGAGGSSAGAAGSTAGAGGSSAGAGGSSAGAGGSSAGAGGSSAGAGGSTAGAGGSSAGSGGSSAGAGGGAGSTCDAGGLPAATGSMQLVDGSTWSACAGGLSSDPTATKLSIVGGAGAPDETWTLTIVGQTSSAAVVTCNDNGIVCAFSSGRVQGSSTTKYASTAKPFDVKVSVWTAGSFIGTAENVQMARTISVPGQVDQQIVDGVTVVLVATKK